MSENFRRLLKGEMPVGYILYKIFGEKATRIIYKKIFSKAKVKLYNGVVLLNLLTFDDFNQSNHPDITVFNEKYFLTVTPYTYSNELIENPSLYVSNDGIAFAPLGKQPLVDLPERNFRNHLSDPAIFVQDDCLVLYFRECIYREGESRRDFIYKMQSLDGLTWDAPKNIEYKGVSCIAPNFCSIKDTDYVYYVVDENEVTYLKRGIEQNGKITEIEQVIINNPFSSAIIWHVNVEVINNRLTGLFTYMEKPGKGKTELYYAESEDGINWNVIKEIVIADKSEISSIYKSTIFIDSKKQTRIIVSAIDKYMRWGLYTFTV
jgi:hypothetical protein